MHAGSNTVPKVVTQKTTLLIFVPNMPKTNTVFSVLRSWPQVSSSMIIITLLLAKLSNFITDGSDFGSPRALQCSRGYE